MVKNGFLSLLEGKWVMRQSWRDLLFVHWPVHMDFLRPLIPPGLQIDTYNDTAWIGIVPFRLEAIYLRGVPKFSWFPSFLEINLRTYVSYNGKPGVFFISLDATDRTALKIARLWYRLPYYHSQISNKTEGSRFHYYGCRNSGTTNAAEIFIQFTPSSDVFYAKEGSLEHWLTERYRLYTVGKGNRLYYADIDHPVWELQTASGEISTNSLVSLYGIHLPSEAPLLHFSKGTDALINHITRLS